MSTREVAKPWSIHLECSGTCKARILATSLPGTASLCFDSSFSTAVNLFGSTFEESGSGQRYCCGAIACVSAARETEPDTHYVRFIRFYSIPSSPAPAPSPCQAHQQDSSI